VTARRPKKAERSTPAPVDWIVRPASRAALRQWENAVAAEPNLMAGVRDRLLTRPLDRSGNPNRTHRLRPPLHEGRVGDAKLPQWQHEITAAGRIWYCPDRDSHTVWVTRVSLEPPRETYRRNGVSDDGVRLVVREPVTAVGPPTVARRKDFR